MKQVGVLEAKTHLSRLLDELERTGEPVVITRHGKPVATISAGAAETRPRAKSANELSDMFRKLRSEQPRDPEIAGREWREVKALGRS